MGSRTRIKICGVIRPEDARDAVELGVDALGLNFAPQSSRFLNIEQAIAIVRVVPPGVDLVAVFVDATLPTIRATLDATGIQCVQLHGDEPASTLLALKPARIVRAFRWRSAETAGEIAAYWTACNALDSPPAALLLDAYHPSRAGGTGAAWNWSEAAPVDLPRPMFLAGGLTPQNVAAAIGVVRPYGVDVAGGVEERPGVKSLAKMRAFIQQVRSIETETAKPN